MMFEDGIVDENVRANHKTMLEPSHSGTKRDGLIASMLQLRASSVLDFLENSISSLDDEAVLPLATTTPEAKAETTTPTNKTKGKQRRASSVMGFLESSISSLDEETLPHPDDTKEHQKSIKKQWQRRMSLNLHPARSERVIGGALVV
eukprot:CAMPEP_0118699500 /NCGR_PEP_ID=MMETSP0800-20121206/15938_1 /TAXON_ID=210618 ORGANISM="Striatella unipunctata, Strain CCMP2910" /NCGR_SAMPLE_ID=MMETSP0800 /ASSEMBLY_ACC=CAM_ASM_000638 /LENGTH=147 /DNA_ID=CAMNT_0006599733 /DNA_START=52 /DNA_END=496 /DNA_ORIENTATION=+